MSDSPLVKHEALKAAFHGFREDPVEGFRVKLRRHRAAEIRKLLSDAQAVDLEAFNKEVWAFETNTLGCSESGRALFEMTLAPERAAELDRLLESDGLELHGNYVWGSATRVYGAQLGDDEDGKENNIRQAVGILNDDALLPLQKAREILKVKGFGRNVTTGLVMLFHPEGFALYNDRSSGVLQQLGYDATSLEKFQGSVAELRDLVGAEDYLELDWFLYLISERRITLGESKPNMWWLNQGQRYEIERAEGIITAPVTRDSGSIPYHWQNVARLHKGDILLNYVRGKIVAVSQVSGPPKLGIRKSDGGPDLKVHEARLYFHDLSEPVVLDAIPQESRIAEKGPFNKNGGVKQGYLFELSTGFVNNLEEAAPELYQLIMSLVKNPPDDHPGTDKALQHLLSTIARRKKLPDLQAAADWLVNHEWDEVVGSRKDLYERLGPILRAPSLSVDEVRSCAAGQTVLGGFAGYKAQVSAFFSHARAPELLTTLLGKNGAGPDVDSIDAFIEEGVNIAFHSNIPERKNYSGAALFASVLLTAAFPEDYVDYRDNRWSYLAKHFDLPARAKLGYGGQLLWAADTATKFAETPTFERYFTGINPNWTVAGLAALFAKNKEIQSMIENGPITDGNGSTTPRNLILYGPPGTGKTYISVQKAVEICDGNAPKDREEVARRFRELQEDNRIAFVTFHQAYGYEDFVEGIRPVLDDGSDTEGPTSSGSLRYECHDGVFKTICSLAKKPPSRAKVAYDLDPASVRIWKMSLGNTRDPSQAHVYEECIENNCILLGYGYGLDFTGCDDRKVVRDKLHSEDPSIKNTDYNVTSVNAFKNEMKVGDLVIVSDGNTKFRAVGKVAGEYEFYRPEEYGQRRPVEWLLALDESLPRERVFRKNLSQMTLYELRRDALKMDALKELLSEPEEERTSNYVLIIDEINRGSIAKILGELITLLELDKRLDEENELKVILPYSREEFGIPANLYVIGTMNTADRSIAFMDTALRRRFEFEEMMPDSKVVRESAGKDGEVDGVNVADLLDTINARIELLYDRDHQIGHSYLMKVQSLEGLRKVFLVNVIPLLQEYFYGDWGKLCSVLGCPYDAETGARVSNNDRPLIKATPLDVKQAQGLDDEDLAGRLRYQVNSDFLAATGEELTAFFLAVMGTTSPLESGDEVIE